MTDSGRGKEMRSHLSIGRFENAQGIFHTRDIRKGKFTQKIYVSWDLVLGGGLSRAGSFQGCSDFRLTPLLAGTPTRISPLPLVP